MSDVQFIYNSVESRYSNLECYSVYDFRDNDLVCDLKFNKTLVMIDKNNELIYFMGMETEGHWILEKNFYFKIIQEFLNSAERYGCKDFKIVEDCTGGQIYYKYK